MYSPGEPIGYRAPNKFPSEPPWDLGERQSCFKTIPGQVLIRVVISILFVSLKFLWDYDVPVKNKKKIIATKLHKSQISTKSFIFLCFTPLISNIDSSGNIIIIYLQH